MSRAGAWAHCRIGSYRCIDLIGAGGMGEVYRAVHTDTSRVVALKVLTSARRDRSLLERFRNEARIHAALHHANIAVMHEFLDEPDAPCIVMEYVDGETLEQRIRRRGALPLKGALPLLQSLIEAVGHMHGRGILHRDIKLTNIKVNEQGTLKLLDFGIAKGPLSPQLTADGSVVGTLQSLAPEQLAGLPAGPRSDIWALGVVMYEMLAGRHPFAHDDPETITERIRAGRFVPATRIVGSLSPGIDSIIGRCLKVDPRQRYDSCSAMLDDLRSLMEPGPSLVTTIRNLMGDAIPNIPATWFGKLGRIAAVTVAVVAVGYLAWSLKPATADEPDKRAVVLDTISFGDTDSQSRPALRTVTIHVVAGTAQVWQEGAQVGTTPYRLEAALGSEVSLTLRQPGHRDQEVRFDVTEGRSEYSFVMRPLGSSSSRTVPMAVLALGWFGLPWRRKRVAKQSVSTAIRPAPMQNGLPVEARIVIGSLTDTGCVRDGNEDSLRVVRPLSEDHKPAGLLAVVCDGMGGHAAGETASRLAVEEVASSYSLGDKDPGLALAAAVKRANRAVHDAARGDKALAGMGTTCTALVLQGGMAWSAHVGDSRCYLIRDGGIYLMTEDHSAVMAMVREGALSLEEARTHPDKNVISRALGSHSEVEVSQWARPLVIRPGDRFLLCTDGLYDVASDAEVLQLTDGVAPHRACAQLIDFARERGAPDNVSVIVLAVPESTSADTIPITRQFPVTS